MGLVYKVSFGGISVAAAQDVFELTAAANTPFQIIAARMGQVTAAGDANAAMLPVQVARTDGTTGGSGGAGVTPEAIDTRFPAAVTTVTRNNTTLATVATPIVQDSFNVQGGFLYQPTPEELIRVEAGGVAVLRLPIAPSTPLSFYGTLVFEEL